MSINMMTTQDSNEFKHWYFCTFIFNILVKICLTTTVLHIAHAQPLRHSCHCIVETELIQLGQVPTCKLVNFGHPANFILGSLVVCISQPFPKICPLFVLAAPLLPRCRDDLYPQRLSCRQRDSIVPNSILVKGKRKLRGISSLAI